MRDALSSIRAQSYRLAWVTTSTIFVVAVLMWITPHEADQYLAAVGLFFMLIVAGFSIAARRFVPFAWALVGLALLGATIWA